MIKRNVIKLFGLFCGLTMLFCPASVMKTQAADIPPMTKVTEGETIEPRQPVTGWIYKQENGKTYRRLYNYSTGEWIGEWILVG